MSILGYEAVIRLFQRRQLDGLHVDLGGETSIVKGVVVGVLFSPSIAEMLKGVIEAPEPPVLCPFA